jgi:hypothetical protein
VELFAAKLQHAPIKTAWSQHQLQQAFHKSLEAFSIFQMPQPKMPDSLGSMGCLEKLHVAAA